MTGAWAALGIGIVAVAFAVLGAKSIDASTRTQRDALEHVPGAPSSMATRGSTGCGIFAFGAMGVLLVIVGIAGVVVSAIAQVGGER